MKKILSTLLVLLALLWIASPGLAETASPGGQKPYGIALIGDPHLPGKNLPAKEEVIRTINGWSDIDLVVVLGDVCKGTGTAEEYAFAKRFFNRLRKPLRLIAGNHDVFYEDEPDFEGRKLKASAATRRKKLARFAETFGMKEAYGTELLGGYLLVYLSPDDLETDLLVQLSEERLTWLAKVLAGHRDVPTIVFFHAPLAGTLTPYNERVNTPSFIAQPAGRLGELLRANPQVFLWVAGHLHVPATNESYSSPVNVYEKRVTVIHNADLERKLPWTNVLYLYPEKIIVRTYEHWQKSWLPDLERTIRPPGR
ncbi:MAG: metallophosphoesterase [Proteobacteria bacterium]|nr:metallophosphoesterase [Pseudomonadota bacterium]